MKAHDFGDRLDLLVRALYKIGRIDAPTQAALSRASGVKEDAISHSRKKLTLSTTNMLLLWENLSVQKKYWTAPLDEVVDGNDGNDETRVMHFLDQDQPYGPEAASRSTETRAQVGGVLSVPIPIDPELLKRAMMELTIERGDLPEVQKAVRRAEPPEKHGNDLLWWFQFYDEAREAARNGTMPPSSSSSDDRDRQMTDDPK